MKTATDIIKALGGEVELAQSLGFKYRSRVANWRLNGIPRQVWPDLLDVARAKNVALSIDVLRQCEPDRASA